jgi:hypothetical protein
VYLANDGEWYKIDADADPVAVGWPRGIVNEVGGIGNGSNGSIRLLGEVAGFSGLTPGALVYASTTAGAATQTKPAATNGGGQVAIVPVGVAISSTTVMALPYFRSRFVKRETLAAEGALRIAIRPSCMKSPASNMAGALRAVLRATLRTLYSKSSRIRVIAAVSPLCALIAKVL